jgi:uracil phosphoribosyltransferase
MAVDVLKSRGVPEERILFLNLIASPEGIRNFASKFPKLRVVTAFVDEVWTPILEKYASMTANISFAGLGLEEVSEHTQS